MGLPGRPGDQWWVTTDVFRAIHAELLKQDPCYADMWFFECYAFVHASTVQHLEWSQISLEDRRLVGVRWVPSRPFSDALWEVIERRLTLREHTGEPVPWVFHIEGRRVGQTRWWQAFCAAKAAAGYAGYAFPIFVGDHPMPSGNAVVPAVERRTGTTPAVPAPAPGLPLWRKKRAAAVVRRHIEQLQARFGMTLGELLEWQEKEK